MVRFTLLVGLMLALAAGISSLVAADEYKRLPPAGIEIDADDRQRLTERIASIEQQVADQSNLTDDDPAWVPDVEVLVRAVQLALQQNLFYKPNEVKAAGQLLDEAQRRIEAVAGGARGMAVLGFDGSPAKEPTLLVGGFDPRSTTPSNLTDWSFRRAIERVVRSRGWTFGCTVAVIRRRRFRF